MADRVGGSRDSKLVHFEPKKTGADDESLKPLLLPLVGLLMMLLQTAVADAPCPATPAAVGDAAFAVSAAAAADPEAVADAVTLVLQ